MVCFCFRPLYTKKQQIPHHLSRPCPCLFAGKKYRRCRCRSLLGEESYGSKTSILCGSQQNIWDTNTKSRYRHMRDTPPTVKRQRGVSSTSKSSWERRHTERACATSERPTMSNLQRFIDATTYPQKTLTNVTGTYRYRHPRYFAPSPSHQRLHNSWR